MKALARLIRATKPHRINVRSAFPDTCPGCTILERLPFYPRIQRIAQAIAKQVEAKERDHDRNPREGDDGIEIPCGAITISARASFSIAPHSGVGGCAPSPRNDRLAAEIIDTPIRIVK